MKQFSVELLTREDRLVAKVICLQKRRTGYYLLNKYITEPSNLKALSGESTVSFCIDYLDTIIETVSVPPVKDSKTFKMLVKNKLKDALKENVSYLMAYKTDHHTTADSSGSLQHRVYLIPEKVFEDDAHLSHSQKLKMKMFTVSDFSLCGTSNYFQPDKMVFHAFADECKVMVTVSKGDTVYYTRTMEYQHSAASNIENIFYESINLTYMFVSKNLRIEIDMVMLTGQLADKEGLAGMIFSFTNKPLFVPIPSKLIANCSYQDFLEYMIPISLSLLDNSYDFTPEKYRVETTFNVMKSFVNVILVLAFFVLIVLNMDAAGNLFLAKDKLEVQQRQVATQLSRYQNMMAETNDEMFGYYYIRQAQKLRMSPLDMFEDVQGILDLADYSSVVFSTDKKGFTATIEGKLTFESRLDMDAFRSELEKKCSEVISLNKYKLENKTAYDDNNSYAVVSITVTKGE